MKENKKKHWLREGCCNNINDIPYFSVEQVRKDFIKMCNEVIFNDRSLLYRYGEARPSDGEVPEKGQRWTTPREIAEAWIRELEHYRRKK